MQDLQRRGVRLIIDLRESGTATLREGDQARQLQMQYVNVPLPPFSAPAKDDVSRVLVLLAQRGEVPVFVHCRRGKDRTGTVIACYRMQRDGWDRAQAMAEAERYGMSWTERGMRSFIRHFSPLAPATLPGGSAPVAVQP
jgi:protein tyrosine/serine phosphatase